MRKIGEITLDTLPELFRKDLAILPLAVFLEVFFWDEPECRRILSLRSGDFGGAGLLFCAYHRLGEIPGSEGDEVVHLLAHPYISNGYAKAMGYG